MNIQLSLHLMLSTEPDDRCCPVRERTIRMIPKSKKVSGYHNFDKEYEYIYAAFNLWGKDFDPQEVTDCLGLLPTECFRAGNLRNKSRPDRWKHSYWSLSSKGKIKSTDLTVHFDWLLNQLEPARTRLVEILNTEGNRAQINCFWILPSEHEYLILRPELLKKIADLGLGIEVDTYSCEDYSENNNTEKKSGNL